MLEDTMSTMEEEEELDEDVQAEVDKILLEITTDKTKVKPGEASIVLPEPGTETIGAGLEEEEEKPEEDLEEMQERLQALRS